MRSADSGYCSDYYVITVNGELGKCLICAELSAGIMMQFILFRPQDGDVMNVWPTMLESLLM